MDQNKENNHKITTNHEAYGFNEEPLIIIRTDNLFHPKEYLS